MKDVLKCEHIFLLASSRPVARQTRGSRQSLPVHERLSSDVATTGRRHQAQRLIADILRGVHITLMMRATSPTPPLTIREC